MGITVEALHEASEPLAQSQAGGAKANDSVAQSGGPKPPAGPRPDLSHNVFINQSERIKARAGGAKASEAVAQSAEPKPPTPAGPLPDRDVDFITQKSIFAKVNSRANPST